MTFGLVDKHRSRDVSLNANRFEESFIKASKYLGDNNITEIEDDDEDDDDNLIIKKPSFLIEKRSVELIE